MSGAGADRDSPLLERLRRREPLVGVELRPPRSGLDHADSLDAWIDLHHSIRRVSHSDSAVFLTDNAVGAQEEENLRHLTTNLVGDVRQGRVVPFLTCKHRLEYCMQYAQRAAASGIGSLVVLGGDRRLGPPRCVEHGYLLREKIRRELPDLVLGGWANPHADPSEQVGYLLSSDFTAEFFLTQVVSHHDLEPVDAFLEEAERRGVPWPAVFGVFYYRSANPDTLERLSRFFSVPVEGLKEEFASGAGPEEVCARTIRALRERGVESVYVSNLGTGRAADQMARIREAVVAPGG